MQMTVFRFCFGLTIVAEISSGAYEARPDSKLDSADRKNWIQLIKRAYIVTTIL